MQSLGMFLKNFKELGVKESLKGRELKGGWYN